MNEQVPDGKKDVIIILYQYLNWNSTTELSIVRDCK
jgi:hypothetical protein